MKRHVDFATAILAMLMILTACGRNATPTEPAEEVPTYSHVNLLTVQAIGTVGEVGQVTASQANSSDWHAVTLAQSYTSPVVVMQPLSFNGSHPSVVRLKNVTGDSFEFQIDEWDYLDGGHTAEELSYLVLEAGQHALESGLVLEAGTTTLDQSWKTVSLSQSFTDTPVIFTQAQTDNDPSAITTRQKGATTSSFQVRLQEEQASDSAHAEETVGYIALSAGSGILDSKGYEVGVTPDVVTHRKWTTIDFERNYTTPIFLAHMQTYDGGDPAALRYRNLSESSVQVFVEEEKSADSEIGHTSEVVGYAVFETGFAFGETPADSGGNAPSQLEGDPNAPAVGAIGNVAYNSELYPDDYAVEESTGMLVSTNTILIAFELKVTVAEVNKILDDIKGEILGAMPLTKTGLSLVVRVPTQSHEEIIALAESTENRPEVRYSIELFASQLQSTKATSQERQPLIESQAISYPYFEPEWTWDVEPEGGNYGLELSRVPQLWNLNAGIGQKATFTGTLIAEKGIAENHPDLRVTDLRSPFFKENNEETPAEKDHGTMVTGIVGADFNNFEGTDGVTPFSNLLLESVGALELQFPPNLLSKQSDIRVINISAGFGGIDERRALRSGRSFYDSMFRFSDDLTELPLIIVAAGNQSPSKQTANDTRNAGSWQYAAMELGAPNMIVVEGIDVNKKRYANLVGGSNIGGHVSAPATDVGSIGFSEDYLVDSGTSFAAPYVTGLASYLFSLDPTLTTSEVRSLIIDNAVADVQAGMSPRIDAFASAMAIDKLRGNTKIRTMLLDVDDGTLDGNTRLNLDGGGLNYEEGPNANGLGPIGDGEIDIKDFRRWRDWLLQLNPERYPDARLNGMGNWRKTDLNLNYVDATPGEENIYPRGDYNGDGILDPTAASAVPGFEGKVTDFQVLHSLFDDPNYSKAQLSSLIESTDLEVWPESCFAIDDITRVEIAIRVTGTETPIETRTHTRGSEARQIYTAPVTPQGYTVKAEGLNSKDEVVVTVEEEFPFVLGSDALWDPNCTPGIDGPYPNPVELQSYIGYTTSESFTFGNSGTAPLAYTIVGGASWLSFESAVEGTLNPEETTTVTLQITCSSTGNESTTLVLESENPETLNVILPVELTCRDLDQIAERPHVNVAIECFSPDSEYSDLYIYSN